MSANIEIIFATARQLQAVDRPGYLDEACQGDAELRAQVEALLAADADAGSFLKTAHSDNDDPDATLTMTRAYQDSKIPAEQAGQLIDRYKLLQQIGEGGFGTVWMAEQKVPVKRRVALKIIKLGMDTKQIIARFEAERQALAMMDHPNIAKVLDAGATDAGRPYFVMELVRGIPILEYCDTEQLDTKSRLKLFMLVCNAIQHAHQKGIIHRDIKPSNVLVTMHDGEPVPKVIDFGIAKATSQELTQKTLYTEYHQMVGTPAYMSPEQAEMSGLDIDTRSDTYSLGVLLYELLTGTTPFDHKELMDRGFAEMMRIIREETPHKPSTRLSTLGDTANQTAQQRHTDLKKLGTVLRGDLDWIVMRCLEKNRTRRYDTATGLAADINRHLNNEPVEAGPPSAGYKLRKFVRRNKGVVIAGSAIAATLLIGMAGTTWGLWQAKQAKLTIQSQRDKAFDTVTSIATQMGEYDLELMNLMGLEIFDDDIIGTTGGIIIKNEKEGAVSVELYKGPYSDNRGPASFDEALNAISQYAYFSFRSYADESKKLYEMNNTLESKTDAAEWSAYTANLAMAQMAMDNGNWPEARDRLAQCPENKRGWEWNLLNQGANGTTIALRGHTYDIRSAVFSPDGSMVLTASNDHTARLWDAKTGAAITELRGHTHMVSNALFSPDGSRLLTVSHDNTARLWDSKTGESVAELPKYASWASKAVFSPDGSTVLTAVPSGQTARLWDAQTGDTIAELRGHTGELWDAVFSPNSSTVLTASDDHTARLWDARTGAVIFELHGHTDMLRNAVFSPDGSTVLTVSDDHTARLWNAQTGDVIAELHGHTRLVNSAIFSPDGLTVLTRSSGDHTARLWNAQTGTIIAELRDHTSWISSAIFSPDGSTVLTASADHTARLWDAQTGETIAVLRGHTSGVDYAIFSPDGSIVLTATYDDARLWDTKTGAMMANVVRGGNSWAGRYTETWYPYFQFSPDGSTILAIHKNMVHLLDSAGSTRTVLDLHPYDDLLPLRLAEILGDSIGEPTLEITTPDGTRRIVGSSDQTVQFFTVPDGSDPTETPRMVVSFAMPAPIANLKMTDDGTRLVIELDDGSARIFDTRSAEEQAADVQRTQRADRPC